MESAMRAIADRPYRVWEQVTHWDKRQNHSLSQRKR